MKFIQVRKSGDVFYYTDALADRDDIDVIEAPEGSTPDTVRAALEAARNSLAREAELAAAEAEKAGSLRIAARTRKPTDVVLPPGVTITEAASNGQGK